MKSKRIAKFIITSIFAILACVALAFTIWGGDNLDFDRLKQNITDNLNLSAFSFSKLTSVTADTETPLLQTDFNDIFYTIDTKNSNAVCFYQYSDGKFEVIEPTATLPITVKYSGQEMTANVSYILKDGKISGYGLCSSSGIYDYAFFKLKTLPASHQVDEKDVLLLIDTEKDDFYKKDKTYDISFYYSLETAKISNFVYDVNANVGLDGKISSNYAIFTDEALESARKLIPFFTSRYYPSTTMDADFDVDLDNKERAAITRLASQAHYMYARVTDDGTVFLRRTETGFDSIVKAALNEKERVIASFNGDFNVNYIRYNDYVININTFEITNLTNAVSTKIENDDLAIVEHFACTDDATKLVIAGKTHEGEQIIIFSDMATGRIKSLKGDLLYTNANANFAFAGNETVFFNKPSSKSGKIYCSCLVSWEKVFSLI
ncbi:MAG: hypothetical protein K5917_01625 [Clostridiales bacterium]|nr:hypothetical protein [Clostridiales bacterium]